MFQVASSRLWVILRKEFAVVRNNPGMVLKPAVALTIVLMAVVYLVDSDNDTVRLGIVDESRSEHSRDLQSRYEAALVFEITTYASAAALNEAIELAEIDGGTRVLITETAGAGWATALSLHAQAHVLV